MRNTLFFIFALLINVSLIGMEERSYDTFKKPLSGDSIPQKPRSGSLLLSLGSKEDLIRVVSQDTYGEPLNVSVELNNDFVTFLQHISKRVQEVTQEISSFKDPRNDNFEAVTSSIWSWGKSKIRAVQTIVMSPESENMAQALIKKIENVNDIKKENNAYEWHLDAETQELVTTVQAEISTLMQKYQRDDSGFMQTQMAYLAEYDERINRVNNLMGESLK